MAALRQRRVGTEQVVVGPDDHVRRSRADLLVAARAAIGLLGSCDGPHRPRGPIGPPLGPGHATQRSFDVQFRVNVRIRPTTGAARRRHSPFSPTARSQGLEVPRAGVHGPDARPARAGWPPRRRPRRRPGGVPRAGVDGPGRRPRNEADWLPAPRTPPGPRDHSKGGHAWLATPDRGCINSLADDALEDGQTLHLAR